MSDPSVRETHWAIIQFAVAASASYVAWLVAFERWFEPWLRRRGGAILSCSIVWVPAGGPFRIWGVRGRVGHARSATVGILGGGTILLSAVLPVVALLDLAARANTDDAIVAASSYLASLPMIAFFALRVLSRKPETDESR
jgi:hypothetical protein